MSEFPPPGSPPPPGAPPPEERTTSHWGTPPGPTGHPGHPAYPGQTPGPGPGPGPGQYAPPPGQPPRGMLGAAHKPGAIPLRPLGLGDLYDGAFRIIRFNPKATVGAAVLVAAVAMLVPVLVVAALTWTVGITYDVDTTSSTSSSSAAGAGAGEVIAYSVLLLGYVLQFVGTILVTGMMVHVVHAAAIGRRISLEEAWRATRGRRWRLVGLTLLLALTFSLLIGAFVVLAVLLFVVAPLGLAIFLFIVSLVAFAAFLCWAWIRVYYLAVPPLMLEGVGVVGSIGRGYRLTLGGFWRLFGIGLLTMLVTGFAGYILAIPFSLGGTIGALAVDESLALFVTVLGSALAQVASSAFVAPFTSAVTSLQYLDQRMRKEAYDLELMRSAGVLER